MKTSTLPAGPAGDRSTDWLDHAACRRSDPELFFPVTDIRAARAQVEAAKKVPPLSSQTNLLELGDG
jgi:hypothetical protein